MANGSASTDTASFVSAPEIFEKLGDHELAAVHALSRNEEGLDETGLASEARLGVSAAAAAAEKLGDLGLVKVSVDGSGKRRFKLIRERLSNLVEEAPSALFS